MKIYFHGPKFYIHVMFLIIVWLLFIGMFGPYIGTTFYVMVVLGAFFIAMNDDSDNWLE